MTARAKKTARTYARVVRSLKQLRTTAARDLRLSNSDLYEVHRATGRLIQLFEKVDQS